MSQSWPLPCARLTVQVPAHRASTEAQMRELPTHACACMHVSPSVLYAAFWNLRCRGWHHRQSCRARQLLLVSADVYHT